MNSAFALIRHDHKERVTSVPATDRILCCCAASAVESPPAAEIPPPLVSWLTVPTEVANPKTTPPRDRECLRRENAGESAICPGPAQPSAEITRVDFVAQL